MRKLYVKQFTGLALGEKKVTAAMVYCIRDDYSHVNINKLTLAVKYTISFSYSEMPTNEIKI